MLRPGGLAMSLLFRSLFLIGLLFVDLTDDVCALVLPTMPIQPPLLATEHTTLVALRYRQQCFEQIERPFTLLDTLLRDWTGDSPAPWWVPTGWTTSRPSSGSLLYVLMSLQR